MDDLLKQYLEVRKQTETICKPLAQEDYVVQPFAEVSPPKWHLGHTTWFFENFLTKPFLADFKPHSEHFSLIFNSYYKGVGKHWVQGERGHLSRPTVDQVYQYRKAVDNGVSAVLTTEQNAEIERVVQIGLNHEQQHQELLLMDIKAIFATNPSAPAYSNESFSLNAAPKKSWISFGEGLREFGYSGRGFCFDNEKPQHRHFIHSFEILNRAVTNGEFAAFINDGGYQKPELWLSDGWQWVQQNNIQSPMYWQKQGSDWHYFTLHGPRPLDSDSPICHVSFYEADAFARWSEARLPTEFELELALQSINKNEFLALNTDRLLADHVATELQTVDQDFYLSGTWEWTQSSYLPYPGFKPFAGALGEYNGKFMCNQMILRGGSLGTPKDHLRCTYRNFFYP